jgi:hypothetical protein
VSQNLYWNPAEPVRQHPLSKELKYVMQRQYPGLEVGETVELGVIDMPWLRGFQTGLDLAKCTSPVINEVGDLLRAIGRHGKIELRVKE